VELIRVSSKGQAEKDTPELQTPGRWTSCVRQRRGLLVERIEDGGKRLAGALGLAERPISIGLHKLLRPCFDEVRIFDLDVLTRSDNAKSEWRSSSRGGGGGVTWTRVP